MTTKRTIYPSEMVICPACGSQIDDVCRSPDGSPKSTSHRARVMLSILGDKAARAVDRVEAAVSDYEKRRDARNEKLAQEHELDVDSHLLPDEIKAKNLAHPVLAELPEMVNLRQSVQEDAPTIYPLVAHSK